MKIEFNKDEMATLTAIVITLGEGVKNGILECGDNELTQRAKEAYSSLRTKVLAASIEIMKDETLEYAKGLNGLNIDEEE